MNVYPLDGLLNVEIDNDVTDSDLMKICHLIYERSLSYCEPREHDVENMGKEMFIFAITYNQISLANILLKIDLITKDTKIHPLMTAHLFGAEPAKADEHLCLKKANALTTMPVLTMLCQRKALKIS